MCTRLVLGCLATVLLFVSAATAAPRSSVPRPASELRAGLEEIVAAGTPGAAALIRDAGMAALVTVGSSKLDGSAPIHAGQPFRVGSISKSFVAATTLVLVRDGRLGLDDTVGHWLPNVPRGAAITVRQLLQHTSGVTDSPELLEPLLLDPNHSFTPMQVVRAAVRTPPEFDPGHGWAYANANYVLLGLIVEKVTGKSLGRVLREVIVEPLGLHDTAFPVGANAPADVVRGYLAPENSVVPTVGSEYLDVTATNPSWTWAAGALVSSAADVSRFYSALLGGRIVPRRLVGVMTKARPTVGGLGYGLGLLRVPTVCGAAFGHDGEIFGYTSLALSSRNGRRSVVLLANASHPKDAHAILGVLLELGADALCDSARA